MKKLLLTLGAVASVAAPVAAVVACGTTDPVDQLKSQYKDQINKYAKGTTKTDLLAKLDKVKTQEDLTKFATDADFMAVEVQAIADSGKAKTTTAGSGTAATTQAQVDSEQTVIAGLAVKQITTVPAATSSATVFDDDKAKLFGIEGFTPKTGFNYGYTSTATELTVAVDAGAGLEATTPTVFTLNVKTAKAAPSSQELIAEFTKVAGNHESDFKNLDIDGVKTITVDWGGGDLPADARDVITVHFDDGSTSLEFDHTAGAWVLHS